MWTDADEGWSALRRQTKIGYLVEPALMQCCERPNTLVEARLRVGGGQPCGEPV
jgi:hypothetical protein